MDGNFEQEEILKWTEIFFDPDREFLKDISQNTDKHKKVFIDQIAKSLYEDMRRARMLITAPFTFNKEFDDLSAEEKKVWFDYASEIPAKLKSLNLFIRPYKDFCRTCIITDTDIEKLACMDHEYYLRHSLISHSGQGKNNLNTKRIKPGHVPFHSIPGARKWYFKELNYLIPPQLKKIGYEIIRPDEIYDLSSPMIKNLARAIHSRYLQKMRSLDANKETDLKNTITNSQDDSGSQVRTDFDNLPEDIKYSNRDNALHIPTKLLSIGYKIRPVKKGFKSVTLHLNKAEIEMMAFVEHIRWSWDKRLNGWIYGNVKDISNKVHPGLIPYQELPESEKEKDRELVRLIPYLLQDIDHEAYSAGRKKIRTHSYEIKPQSNIHMLLNETRQLNEEIKNIACAFPELDEKITIINNKIEETIKEVEGSYDYARHIQETFLPHDLFVRECFPDSFVLFKPKDIISGDFYFFSKQGHLVIFSAIDCTGHGIPGALLSTIGYGIIDQAVNEIKLTDPPEILQHLYSKVHRFLRWDEDETGLADAMDIALCKLDLRTNLLTYSGVKNPLYHIVNGELIEYRSNNFIENWNGNCECKFLSETIQLNIGDTIYLGSDGYTDQFGGKNHRKYQNGRFKTFLLDIQKYSMSEQSDKLYREIEDWRAQNNEEQTDDILVIGIKI